MYNSDSSRNPWGNEQYTYSNARESLDDLKKAIREQKILLAAAGEDIDESPTDVNLNELKRRIVSLTQEIYDKQQNSATRGRSTLTPSQWWSRYQLNLRQLEDIAEQRQALTKEINYLVGTGIKELEDELKRETDRLNRTVNVRSAAFYPMALNGNMTESERIRAKAQAMVAARLGKNNNSSTSLYANNSDDEDTQAKTAQFNRLVEDIAQIQKQVDSIIEKDLKQLDGELEVGNKQLKDRQMFEQGLYVNDEVARFIDQLDRSVIEKKPYNIPPPPPLPLLSSYSQVSPPPPPIPTSQRPGTPRSEADIKAEAYKRIEERRKHFIRDTVSKRPTTITAIPEDNKISEEEKAAQERMRKAEAEARARLESMREKREKLRKEAAEAEEKKRKAAAEASAIAEAEMLAEKKLQQQEEQERQAKIKRTQEELEEKQRIQREAELERLRLEKEEKDRIEAEEVKRRDQEERHAEEVRIQKARKAAEEAAHEKRLRRKEIEQREKELEAARLQELERRRQWEEAEHQKRLEEERRIREKEQEAARIRQNLEQEEEEEEEEEERRRRDEQEKRRLEVEVYKKAEEEERMHRQQKLQEEREAELQKEEEERIRLMMEAEQSINSRISIQNSTTAGTSGYGVDIEDEVNFSIIYRVNTLYEYQGIRQDDLSFTANETLKAHPSKDKGSDWWYGTSLSTNQMGFFPRTYVEVIEEAFCVKTLYAFSKTREDDLGFSPNEVIVVQPFQDESSDWWYGTNEDTEDSGYFPKTYVEKIDSVSTNLSPTTSIPFMTGPSLYPAITLSDHDLPLALSAPNTPMMKKTNLGIDKTQLSKRRRAASNVSSTENIAIGKPQLLFPASSSVSENLALISWASTMDHLELDAILPEERKRQEAIYELIATEKTYLNDLQMIINVFYMDSGKYLSQDERDVVFSNIDDLLICNTALLSDMESRQKENGNVVDNIGDIFLKHADSLQCYSTYCRNQSYAFKFLQKKRENDQWFEVFLKTAQTRLECRSLDLSHFLLEPVQRITRYPLLLRQILNCTPKTHADYAIVRSALSIAQKVLEDVNEETRRFENNQKMSELSRILDMEATGRLNISGREFVMDGALFKAKSGRKLHGFLFNDILILAEPLKSLNQEGYLYTLYREPMPIERVSVRQQQSMTLKPSFGSGSNSDDLIFQIVSGNQVIAVKTATATQKRQWMSQIQHYSAFQQYN